MGSLSQVIKKYWQVIAVALTLIVIFCVLWLLHNVFLPFVVGFILAALFLPIVNWVEKRLPILNRKPKLKQLRRTTVIIIIYLLCLAFIALLLFFAVSIIGSALIILTQNSSQITSSGLATIKSWITSIPAFSDPSIQFRIDAYLVKAEAALPGVLDNFITSGLHTLENSASMIFGFITMPVFTFFVLNDWDKLSRGFYKALPHWALEHARNIFAILYNVVVRYVRGQLFLGLVVGLCAYVLLLILRLEYSLPLAVLQV